MPPLHCARGARVSPSLPRVVLLSPSFASPLMAVKQMSAASVERRSSGWRAQSVTAAILPSPRTPLFRGYNYSLNLIPGWTLEAVFWAIALFLRLGYSDLPKTIRRARLAGSRRIQRGAQSRFTSPQPHDCALYEPGRSTMAARQRRATRARSSSRSVLLCSHWPWFGFPAGPQPI